MGSHGYSAPVPTPNPAPTYFKIVIENTCDKPISVAIHYENLEGTWVTRGWYEIATGESAYLADTKNAVYYTYARTTDQMVIWKGDDTFQDVAGSGTYGFEKKQIRLSTYGDWTESFNCPEAYGQGDEEDLLEANRSYESGDRETAKKWYLKAAEKGSAEAHFALAYKYDVTPAERLYHYSEAAKKGHAEALDYALDLLLFRANSLRIANPQKALELYYEAKKANPDLHLHDEEHVVNVMKMCAEPKGFDAEQFMKKYDIEDYSEQYPDYYFWELAEEASRGGRFGKPDPELVLNLVIRGGYVPAELMSAVEEVYANWKDGVVKEFNICDHITSGVGGLYCASIKDAHEEEERENKLHTLQKKLGGDAEPLLNKAYDSAVNFIESKASNEEGHGGADQYRIIWIMESEIEQKNQYVELIEKIHAGFVPVPENSLAKADQQLNKMYQHVLQELQKKAAEGDYPVTPDNIRAVQRLWIPYRDASIELFVHMNPSIDKKIWKSWLTEKRIQEFKLILELEY
jgi:hypothetical protein